MLGSTASVTSTLTKPASGYEAWDGTSMATPHVSGVAALAWSCKPTATNVEVRTALQATAFDLGTPGRDVYYGYGLVQAWDACLNLNPTTVDLLSFTASASAKAITLNWETANELDMMGFNLYRAAYQTGPRIKLNQDMIPSLVSPGSSFGALYEYVDTYKLARLAQYYYWLETVDFNGTSSWQGPLSVNLAGQLSPAVPLPIVIDLPIRNK